MNDPGVPPAKGDGAEPRGQGRDRGQGPVEHCPRLRDMFTVGIGHLIVARGLSSGAFGCASFLVDNHCLGVKEAFYRESAPADSVEAAEALSGGGTGMVDMDPAAAKKLVPEAVAYAAESEVTPAKDYRVTFRIFDIGASTSTESFTFGLDGKPFFIQGPRDSPRRCREIMETLNQHRGKGGWDATLVIGGDILDAESLSLDTEGFAIDDDDPEDEDDVPAIEDHRAEGPGSPDEDEPKRRSRSSIGAALLPLGRIGHPSRLAGMGAGCPAGRMRGIP